MNREQQAARIEKIVTTIAERAVSVPPDQRSAFIKDEVEKVRQAFLQTYEADEGLRGYAMEFVDKMSGWIEAQVHERYAEGRVVARVDEVAVEQHRGADADGRTAHRSDERLGKGRDAPKEAEDRKSVV